jgi:hypothetical protein
MSDAVWSVLDGLKNRPRMMALTREGFLATAATLVTVVGGNPREMWKRFLSDGNKADRPGESFDDDWARAVATEAERLILERWER